MRPARRMPKSPGSPAVTARNPAIPEDEKPALVREEAVRELGGWGTEDVREEADQREEDQPAPVPGIGELADAAPLVGSRGQRHVPARLTKVPGDDRDEERTERAHRECAPPRLRAEIGRRQEQD